MVNQVPRNIETNVMAGFRGVLVISNPCLGVSRRVGRVDNVWDSAFAKLTQAMAIAEERNLLPLIVGDLLHDSRDIGQLLPIINLLHGRRALLLPRNGLWQESAQSHIAAILKATGVAYVAGASANRFQLTISENGKLRSMDLEAYTSWGGVERLDPGTVGYIKIPAMNLTIMQSSALPLIEGDESGSRIVAGRLIRLTPVEEAMAINVYAVTNDGVEEIALQIMPIVFSGAASTAEQTNNDLRRDSLFVRQLRDAAATSLEEEGRESLVTLVDDVCNERKVDDWIRAQCLALAKETVVD